jgi:phage terminase small subunit
MSQSENTQALAQIIGSIKNPAHAAFVAEMIATGNRRIAYQKAYPDTSNNSARSAACRLLTRPEVANAIHKGLLAIKHQAIQAVKEHYEGRLSDIEEKRAVLAQIIRGELTGERETSKKGETQTVKVKADPKDRMRAILIDNKMEEEWNRAIELPDTGVKYIE